MTSWLTQKQVGGSTKGGGETCRQLRQDRGPTCKQLRHRRQHGTKHIGRRAIGILSILQTLTTGEFFSELRQFSVAWRKTSSQPTESVNSTPTNTARTELHSMVTFHHANTRGSRAAKLRIAHLYVLDCHPRVMSRSLPHLTLTTSTSSLSPISSTSLIFPTVSLLHTGLVILDPYTPCDVPRQSGGSTQVPSLTSTQRGGGL